MKNMLLFILCCLSVNLCKAADTSSQKRSYNSTFTQTLKTILGTTNKKNYQHNKPQIKQLIEQGADPTVQTTDSTTNTVLLKAISANDTDLIETSLQHGANPNNQDDTVPLSRVKSVETAQLLLRYRADPYVQDQGENLLHALCTDDRGPELLAFFCNQGVQIQGDKDGSYPQHMLCLSLDMNENISRDIFLKKWAILAFFGANLTQKDSKDKTACALLREKLRERAVEPEYHFHSVHTIACTLKLFREAQKHTRTEILKGHLPAPCATIVNDYIGLLWDETCGPLIDKIRRETPKKT
jgi:hypothetical protein